MRAIVADDMSGADHDARDDHAASPEAMGRFAVTGWLRWPGWTATAYLDGGAAAAGIATITAIGAIGGAVSPSLVGMLKAEAGRVQVSSHSSKSVATQPPLRRTTNTSSRGLFPKHFHHMQQRCRPSLAPQRADTCRMRLCAASIADAGLPSFDLRRQGRLLDAV